jgi:hypothetical protein
MQRRATAATAGNTREIMVVDSDTNEACGTRDVNDDPYEPDRDQVRGPYGISHTNKAGRNLGILLGINQLCLPTTYFPKKTYSTWIHPCSKNAYQMDHFILRQTDHKRVRNAGRFGLMGKYSDHYPVCMTLAIGRSLKKKITNNKTTPAHQHTSTPAHLV